MQFTDVEFMTAREKELTLKAWERFLKNGLRKQDFTKRLYYHLTMNCSFIAHYDLGGFYSTYFEDGEDTRKFLGQFDSRGSKNSVEYGDNFWFTRPDYRDLNTAMVEFATPYIPQLTTAVLAVERSKDLKLACTLAEKHGYKLVNV